MNLLQYNTTDVASDWVAGNPFELIQNYITTELGLFLFGMIFISLFLSLAIYSRSWSIPAILAIFIIGSISTIIPNTIIQVIVQGIMIVIIALVYSNFRRRM